MLTKIIGTIWVVTGFLGVLRPEVFRERLRRKLSGKMRIIVILFLLVLGFMMAGNIFKADGPAALTAGIIGALIVIKVIMAVTNKAGDTIFNFMNGRSVKFFRIWAGIILIFGIIFFLK